MSIFYLSFAFALPQFTPVKCKRKRKTPAQGNQKFSISCVGACACICICVVIVYTCVCLCWCLHLRCSCEPALSPIFNTNLRESVLACVEDLLSGENKAIADKTTLSLTSTLII